MRTIFFDIIHEIGQYCLIPCTIVLIIFIIVSVLQIGSVTVEYIYERRKFKENIPYMLQQIHAKGSDEIITLINESLILKRHKNLLKILLNFKEKSKTELTILAQTLLTEEEDYYEKNTSITDLISKLGPMFGLLGTLIPLGPGIVALGEGNTALLSQSMGIAFDTTIIGIITAAICYVVSNIRNRWYKDYISSLESIMECILEEVSKNA